MRVLTPETVLRKRPDVRYRRIDGEAVVLRQSTAEVLVLNVLAADILDLVDGKLPVLGWIDRLEREYAIDRPTLERDLMDFAAELVEAGLLEPIDGAEPPVTRLPQPITGKGGNA
jgi:hypothetical protein